MSHLSTWEQLEAECCSHSNVCTCPGCLVVFPEREDT